MSRRAGRPGLRDTAPQPPARRSPRPSSARPSGSSSSSRRASRRWSTPSGSSAPTPVRPAPSGRLRRSTPAALAAVRKPQPHHLRRERHDLVIRRRARGGPERPDGAGDAGLHEPHVLRLALLVRLAAADGDEDPVAVGGVGDVAPAEDGPARWSSACPGSRGCQRCAFGWFEPAG